MALREARRAGGAGARPDARGEGSGEAGAGGSSRIAGEGAGAARVDFARRSPLGVRNQVCARVWSTGRVGRPGEGGRVGRGRARRGNRGRRRRDRRPGRIGQSTVARRVAERAGLLPGHRGDLPAPDLALLRRGSRSTTPRRSPTRPRRSISPSSSHPGQPGSRGCCWTGGAGAGAPLARGQRQRVGRLGRARGP